MINLKLKNGVLSIIKNQTNTTNSINYYKVKIEVLDKEWQNLEKHVTFYNNSNSNVYDTLLPEDNIVNVPYEVLNYNIPYFIGIYGIAENIKATSNIVKIPVVEGSYKANMIVFDNDRKVEIIAPDGRVMTLNGTYDGTPVTVSNNEDVNMEDLLNKNQLPLSVNVDIPTYQGETEEI